MLSQDIYGVPNRAKTEGVFHLVFEILLKFIYNINWVTQRKFTNL